MIPRPWHARAITWSQFSGDERVYRLILAEAEKANPPIDFNHKFPGAAEAVADQTEVSGAFTQSGWTFMQGALENPIAVFQCGLMGPGARESLPGRLGETRR